MAKQTQEELAFNRQQVQDALDRSVEMVGRLEEQLANLKSRNPQTELITSAIKEIEEQIVRQKDSTKKLTAMLEELDDEISGAQARHD